MPVPDNGTGGARQVARHERLQHPVGEQPETGEVFRLAEPDGRQIGLAPRRVVDRQQGLDVERSSRSEMFAEKGFEGRMNGRSEDEIGGDKLFRELVEVMELVLQRTFQVRADGRPGEIGSAGQRLGDVGGIRNRLGERDHARLPAGVALSSSINWLAWRSERSSAR